MKKMIAQACIAVVLLIGGVGSVAAVTDTHQSADPEIVPVTTELEELQAGEAENHAQPAGETDSADAAHAEEVGGHHSQLFIVFLYLALLLVASKVGTVVEKIGQPAVLGEIAAGIFLAGLGYFGLFPLFDDMLHNEIIAFFAQLGAVILLFQLGLESNVQDMLKVGGKSFLIALAGVIAPFVLGTYIVSPLLFPDAPASAHLFVGTSMVATSVGITAYVFKELQMSKTGLYKTILGAAVIDDVLGLIMLAVVSAIVTQGSVAPGDIAILSLKGAGFLVGAVLIGTYTTPYTSKIFSKISSGLGMKTAFALGFAFLLAYVATLFDLEPIVGAFAAGLVLDGVHFDSFSSPKIVAELQSIKTADKKSSEKIDHVAHHFKHAHIEHLIEEIGLFLVPIFFIYTGLQIDFGSLLNINVYLYAVILTIFAVLGKIVAGFVVKGKLLEKLIIGFAMVPRGEVGLIFAAVGKSLNVLDETEFSVIIVTIILSTFIAPMVIKSLVKKYKEQGLAVA